MIVLHKDGAKENMNKGSNLEGDDLGYWTIKAWRRFS